MFGLSFGEMMVLLVVAVVVLGPKELPRYLRKAGELAGRLRRMAYEMREKSGIDEVLRTEGIDRDIAEIRRLARGEIAGVQAALRSTTQAARIDLSRPAPAPSPPDAAAPTAPDGNASPSPAPPSPGAAEPPARGPATATVSPPLVASVAAEPRMPPPVEVDREREYPRGGVDAYAALPDTAVVYEGSLPPSPLADDAVYARGAAA